MVIAYLNKTKNSSMSREMSVELNNIKLKITEQLEAKGFLFLIKTEDHFFDDFFIKKLSETNYFSSNHLINDVSELDAWRSESQNLKGCHLIEISKISDQVVSYLSKQEVSQEKQSHGNVVYLLPNNVTQRFLDISRKEALFSSCLFLSEIKADFVPVALEEELESIFGKQLTPDLTNYFLASSEVKKWSLGKRYFYAKIYKKELINGITIDQNNLDQFLDAIGAEFLSAATSQVSLEQIQSFFSAFIYVYGTGATLTELYHSQIQLLSRLPKEQLDFLLQLATSGQYQILSERRGAYRLLIPEYASEWKEFKSWVGNEELAFKQFKLFEEIAQEYFSGTGLLLGKARLDQALILKEEIFTTYAWEEKYNVDKELFSSFLLLSLNQVEEQIKTQQKKRASLLKNSVRISIAVSIAFLLSSFTALLAYLERNSAVIQQELAIQSKEEAEQARIVAEKERLEAVQARENEKSALKVAENDRLLALTAQGEAEVQRGMAVETLILAKKSEQEASVAKDVAQKNEKLANEAKITAQINFETSEKLRNQQEARATALEALGYFSSRDFARGIDLVKIAYQKNLSNGGFPLQSDIFNALLNGVNSSKVAEMDVDLDFPAKLLALSQEKDKLAVYTINGELRIYSTYPTLKEKFVTKTGYLKSFEFLSSNEILVTDIKGNLFLLDLTTAQRSDLSSKLPVNKINGLFKAHGQANLWIAKQVDGSTVFYHYEEAKGFVATKDDKSKLQGIDFNKPIFWVEGDEFYRSTLASAESELVVKASSSIQSVTWSTIHSRWMLGLENGNIWSIDPTKQKTTESFTIHATKVSQLVTMPYAHGTELMLSTGFDGGLTFFVFDKSIPLSASVSSRIKFQGHRSWITGFMVDEKKKIAYSISNDRTLKVWPLEINEVLQK